MLRQYEVSYLVESFFSYIGSMALYWELAERSYSVMQSDGNSFCGDVVLAYTYSDEERI